MRSPPPETLRALATLAGQAPEELEIDVLEAAVEIFSVQDLQQPVEAVATELFMFLLSGHGFLVGRSAPGQAPSEGAGIAQVWTAGDTAARVWRAATPRLALARAALSELADREETQRRLRCRQCRGLGWYVTAENTRQICQHTEVSEGTFSRANAEPPQWLRRGLAN